MKEAKILPLIKHVFLETITNTWIFHPFPYLPAEREEIIRRVLKKNIQRKKSQFGNKCRTRWRQWDGPRAWAVCAPKPLVPRGTWAGRPRHWPARAKALAAWRPAHGRSGSGACSPGPAPELRATRGRRATVRVHAAPGGGRQTRGTAEQLSLLGFQKLLSVGYWLTFGM